MIFTTIFTFGNSSFRSSSMSYAKFHPTTAAPSRFYILFSFQDVIVADAANCATGDGNALTDFLQQS